MISEEYLKTFEVDMFKSPFEKNYPRFHCGNKLVFMSIGNVSYAEYKMNIIESNHFFAKTFNFKNILINMPQHW
jgi:hypothetical protein